MQQQLDFIYVEDLIEALLQAAEWGERLRHPQVWAWMIPSDAVRLAMDEKPTLEDLGHLAATALGERNGESLPVTSNGERSPPVLAVRTVVIPPPRRQNLGRVNDFLSRPHHAADAPVLRQDARSPRRLLDLFERKSQARLGFHLPNRPGRGVAEYG